MITTISVKEETKNRFLGLAKYGESQDDLLNRLIDEIVEQREYWYRKARDEVSDG